MITRFHSGSQFPFDYVSWKKSYENLFRIQFRIFKSVFVCNNSLAFSFQALLFNSTSIFLIAIREVTQTDMLRRIPGSDGKICLDFAERFELLQILKDDFYTWVPIKLKKVFLTRKDGSSFYIKLPSIADRCWHTILKFSLSSAHEAIFSFRNFGFRLYNTVFDLQTLVLLNLHEIHVGFQKRIVLFDFRGCCNNFNFNNFIKRLFIPRRLKLVIFRILKLGFIPEFSSVSLCLSFSSLLANILFHEIDFLHSSVRYGYNLIFFLKPFDNELFVQKKLDNFLYSVGFSSLYKLTLLSPKTGFNFLDWNFKLSFELGIVCTPSFYSYQYFLRRVKRIINNSNYGASIKCLKLFPIIRDWHYFNRFTDREFLKSSLFFVKKRAFKIFNSESKQDRYSSKVLINKCFGFSLENKFFYKKNNFFITSHVFFWYNYWVNFSNDMSSQILFTNELNFYFCIHCGVKMS
jgi:hypothetical protein